MEEGLLDPSPDEELLPVSGSGEGESVFFKGAALLGCLCSSGWSRAHILRAALRRVSVVFKKRGGTHQVGGCWGCGGDAGGNVGEWMVDMIKIECIHVRN